MIDDNRPTGTLPTKMPGLRQVETTPLLKQRLQHLLVRAEIVNAGPFATGQTVPRQVASDHGVILIQCPLDHMPVQPHVVVVAMQQYQGRHRCRGHPHLADQLESRRLETPQPTLRRLLACRQIQPVVALVGLGLTRQRLACRQRRQAGA
ncbi:hypothetical protein D3C76_1442660 [compost metagenome]